MARLDDLHALRESLLARMESCESDQNLSVMGRLFVDTVKQIDELDPPAVNPKGSPLDELKAKREGRGAPGADAPASTRERAAARRRR